MNKLQLAEQFRKAVQFYAQSLDEESAMEIATIYAPWKVGKRYSVGEYLTYGENLIGDPQLYQVLQAHVSQEDWKPDEVAALYKPIGIDEQGYPEWSQPTGTADAYNTGDIVNYHGTLYRSIIDGNVWSPDDYPAGWEVYVP